MWFTYSGNPWILNDGHQNNIVCHLNPLNSILNVCWHGGGKVEIINNLSIV